MKTFQRTTGFTSESTGRGLKAVMWSVAICFWSATVAPAVTACDLIGADESSPAQNSDNTPNKFELQQTYDGFGGGPFCSEIARGLEALQLTKLNFCGVAVPPGSEDFSFPEWQSLEPSEHLELMRTAVLWNSLDINTADPDRQLKFSELNEIIRSGQIPPEIRAHLMDGIAAELDAQLLKAELAVAHVDLNGDGLPDTLYRMTPLHRGSHYKKTETGERQKVLSSLTHLVSNPCNDIGLPGPDRPYMYYYEPTIAPGLFDNLVAGQGQRPRKSIFFWQQTLHMSHDNGSGYSRIHFQRDGGAKPLCGFRLILGQ